MKIKNKLILVIMSMLTANNAIAALALDATRYIYHGDKDFISAVVSNPSNALYGAQVWVDNIEEEDTRPTFVVTPSFFKLEKNSHQVFRIMKVIGNLPQDKESIYWLNLQEIPQVTEGNGISLAIRNKVKLIYRPDSLIEGRKNAEENITIEKEGGTRWLVNPTPYIFAISDVLNEKNEPIQLPQPDRDELTMFKPGDRVEIAQHNVESVRSLSDYGRLVKHELSYAKKEN